MDYSSDGTAGRCADGQKERFDGDATGRRSFLDFGTASEPIGIRGFVRRTALACLAAFAVSLLCARVSLYILFGLFDPPRSVGDPLPAQFWVYLALAAAPLAAFAAAGLYCRLRVRSSADGRRARRAAVLAPLACSAVWFAVPILSATPSEGFWLENVLWRTPFLWGSLPSFVIVPLSTIIVLGLLALMPGAAGSFASQPFGRRLARRTALACLAAFAVSWLYGYSTLFMPLRRYEIYSGPRPPAAEPFSLDFWVGAGLAVVPLAAFAAAGAYCWRRARSCEGCRAKAAAVLAPLSCAAVWFVHPVAIMGMAFGERRSANSPEDLLFSTVHIWVDLPYMLVTLLCVCAALGMTASIPGGAPRASAASPPGAARLPPADLDPMPPGIKSFRRRMTLASLAAFAVSWLYGYSTALLPLEHFTLSFLSPPAVEWLSLDFWVGVGLAVVPLAAFAAAGAYGWRLARSCGDMRRARESAVRTPLKAAIAWYLVPAVLTVGLSGLGIKYLPLTDILFWPVEMWVYLPCMSVFFILGWIA